MRIDHSSALPHDGDGSRAAAAERRAVAWSWAAVASAWISLVLRFFTELHPLVLVLAAAPTFAGLYFWSRVPADDQGRSG